MAASQARRTAWTKSGPKFLCGGGDAVAALRDTGEFNVLGGQDW